MRKKLGLAITAVLLMFSAVGYFYMSFARTQTHDALGIYGVQILEKQGVDTYMMAGTWWEGCEDFENFAREWLLFGFAIGLAGGAFGTLMITRTRQHATEKCE